MVGVSVKDMVNKANLKKKLNIPTIAAIKKRVQVFKARRNVKALLAEAVSRAGPTTRSVSQ